jgi:hypothetical protein
VTAADHDDVRHHISHGNTDRFQIEGPMILCRRSVAYD